ncbi:cytochrome c maturation protein CcmE [Marinobacterium sp. AK62]|uniref:Cytochrome c-type biogenesis protein CcmE n=1 Tax=Marinobacterium alkalitolerans TaxID=1542925 RepID=A0ABS3ZE51_9GAMM|nr:cytochrome c maturation protein CcmE [Marinobacterium alkalitolerans]MBP0049988.1 cytochrome c maturation protein CcmE [Marinobacterium alkalitolerans]
MTPKRKQRLMLVTFIVVGVSVAVGLTLFALNQNINLFYSPTQIAQGEAPVDTRIRAGGMVVDGSVKRDPDSLFVQFDITDYDKTVTVEYTGILPDLFREGQGIVAQGSLNDEGILNAVEVLAKHDENYMPPEVAEALAKAGKMPQPEGQEFNK